jgi:hypothetical protein
VSPCGKVWAGFLVIGLNTELGGCKAPSRGDRLPTLKIRVSHALEQGAASTCRHTYGLQYVGVVGGATRSAEQLTTFFILHEGYTFVKLECGFKLLTCVSQNVVASMTRLRLVLPCLTRAEVILLACVATLGMCSSRARS